MSKIIPSIGELAIFMWPTADLDSVNLNEAKNVGLVVGILQAQDPRESELMVLFEGETWHVPLDWCRKVVGN